MANKKKPSEKQEFLAQQRREQRRKTAKEEKKKHHKRKIVTTVVCCAAAVAVVAGGITWFVREKPMTQMIPVEKTEHYSVNAAEVSFYAWQIYNSYINSSTGSDSANLPDTEKPLADQNYDNDTTWEAYFTDAAQKYAENVLASGRQGKLRISGEYLRYGENCKGTDGLQHTAEQRDTGQRHPCTGTVFQGSEFQHQRGGEHVFYR